MEPVVFQDPTTSLESYERLEVEWASFNGLRSERMVACSSGTAALHLALEALQLSPGSKVVVPDFTMVACARAVTLAGLTPVFADVNPTTLTLDPASLLQVYNAHGVSVAAVMPVHAYGRVCDMDGILRVASEKDLYVIEDLAEAHGVRPNVSSDAACWSFYKNKIVGGEEGGAVYTPYERLSDLARCLRCLGFTPTHDFYHAPRGHNYRLANCLADLVRARIKTANLMIRRRREIEAQYDLTMPAECKMPPRDVVWVYDFAVPEDAQQQVYQDLQSQGVPVRYGFKRMTRQPEYLDMTIDNPGSEKASRCVLYFPIDPLRDRPSQINKATSIVKSVLRDKGHL